jgi:hypothetical protein
MNQILHPHIRQQIPVPSFHWPVLPEPPPFRLGQRLMAQEYLPAAAATAPAPPHIPPASVSAPHLRPAQQAPLPAMLPDLTREVFTSLQTAESPQSLLFYRLHTLYIPPFKNDLYFHYFQEFAHTS